jgi:hypothetical protein
MKAPTRPAKFTGVSWVAPVLKNQAGSPGS